MALRNQAGLKGNGSRNVLLAQWLRDKFGSDVKYIDVAGGSGQLTRALLNPDYGKAKSSIVIDPR